VSQWTSASSDYYCPINGAGQQRGIGQMMSTDFCNPGRDHGVAHTGRRRSRATGSV
jgi:hypothetical protein